MTNLLYGMYNGVFGWDDNKNELNIKKHGFDFWRGVLTFEDPNYLLLKDRVDDETGEQRWNTFGLVNGKVLVTTHVYRPKSEDARKNFSYVISSREAEPWEERRYFAQDSD